MKDFVCDLGVTYARHWKTLNKKGLDVGHRGAGNARRNDKYGIFLQLKKK